MRCIVSKEPNTNTTCSASSLESQQSSINILQQSFVSGNLHSRSSKRKRDSYTRKYRKTKKANKNKWTSNGSRASSECPLDEP